MTAIPANGLQAVLAGICLISYLYFAFYIISPAMKEKRIRPLFYLCLFSSLWSFTYVMYYLSGDAYMRDIWQRFALAGMLSCVYILWFFMRYSGLIKNKKAETFLSIAIWVPPLVSVYKGISENAVARDFPSGFWFLFTEIQTTIYNLASIVFLLTFYIRNKTNKSRRQAYILSGSGIVLITMSWLSDYFLGFKDNQNLIPFWLLLWIGMLLFTIKKYRFINIAPEFIARDITENIEEGIILLDPDMKIIFVNKAMRKLADFGETEPILLRDIVFEKHILDDEFRKLTAKGGTSYRAQINFILRKNNSKIPVDIKVKKIIDAYNDLSGYLIIVSRVKDIGYLRTRYGISGRESEVIRQLALGRSYKDIACFLCIKEPTVETHVKSIYNKIGIRNRIELLNLLFEFTLSNPTQTN